MESELLIDDLKERTDRNILQAEKFSALSVEELNQRLEQESWSILECFEHLNLYGDFYMPEIGKRISESNTIPKKQFKTGLLGNYFAKSMLPKEKLNKMKTFRDKDPIGSKLDKKTIDRFLAQQEQTLELLEKARKVDLTKTKTSISISSFLKLRLGDTLRVVVYHNDRHLVQANNILEARLAVQ